MRVAIDPKDIVNMKDLMREYPPGFDKKKMDALLAQFTDERTRYGVEDALRSDTVRAALSGAKAVRTMNGDVIVLDASAVKVERFNVDKALASVGWDAAREKGLVSPVVPRPSEQALREGLRSLDEAVATYRGSVPAIPSDAAVLSLSREKLLADVGGAEIHIRVRSDKVLPGILKDGRFKSQLETRTSGGMLDPAERASFEADFFGFRSADATKHPIYGYLVKPGDPKLAWTASGSVNHYGDVDVVLKPHVKLRATWTDGDSLDRNMRGAVQTPSPVLAPSPATLDRREDLGISKPVVSAGDYRYTEAQVWGGVSVDDIAEVRFPGQAPPSVKRLLKEKGVPFVEDVTVGTSTMRLR
jgi:hypothetical protein